METAVALQSSVDLLQATVLLVARRHSVRALILASHRMERVEVPTSTNAKGLALVIVVLHGIADRQRATVRQAAKVRSERVF